MAANCAVIKNNFGANGIQALTDTVYNNPPKGRSMHQSGTRFHTLTNTDYKLLAKALAKRLKKVTVDL